MLIDEEVFQALQDHWEELGSNSKAEIGTVLEKGRMYGSSLYNKGVGNIFLRYIDNPSGASYYDSEVEDLKSEVQYLETKVKTAEDNYSSERTTAVELADKVIILEEKLRKYQEHFKALRFSKLEIE